MKCTKCELYFHEVQYILHWNSPHVFFLRLIGEDVKKDCQDNFIFVFCRFIYDKENRHGLSLG